MSIPYIQKAANGHFYSHWTEGKRSKRESLGTKDPHEAERQFARWLTLRQMTPETAASELTLSQLWDIYLKKHVERETAAPDTMRRSWAKLEPHFGALTLSQLSADTVEDYGKKRAAGLINGRPGSASTIRRELVALIACLNWCAKRNPPIIAKGDIPHILLPTASGPRERWLRKDEIAALTAAAATFRKDGRMSRGERFLWLALETAARKTAILELTWDRVDFESGMIDFDVPGRKKTKKRRVAVPISKALLPILNQAYAQRLPAKQNPTGLVLDNKAAVWASIQSIAVAAGLAERGQSAGPTKRKPKASGISPHTFRHTAATHMARRGVSLFTIAGVLGNSMDMVEKVYAKHSADRLRAAVDAISGELEPIE